jgi:hypothetical protein
MSGMNRKLQRLVRRFWGRAYPVADIGETQAVHGRHGPHVHAVWTTPEHFAHNNYERSHLPQLCVVASGWKARLIALLVRPETPWTPNTPAHGPRGD